MIHSDKTRLHVYATSADPGIERSLVEHFASGMLSKINPFYYFPLQYFAINTHFYPIV